MYCGVRGPANPTSGPRMPHLETAHNLINGDPTIAVRVLAAECPDVLSAVAAAVDDPPGWRSIDVQHDVRCGEGRGVTVAVMHDDPLRRAADVTVMPLITTFRARPGCCANRPPSPSRPPAGSPRSRCDCSVRSFSASPCSPYADGLSGETTAGAHIVFCVPSGVDLRARKRPGYGDVAAFVLLALPTAVPRATVESRHTRLGGIT